MVGFRKSRARGRIVAFTLALSTVPIACRRPGSGSSPSTPTRARDCQPPTEQQLTEFVRLQSEGVELYKSNQADAALARLEAARKLNPCDVSIYNDLGITAHQQKNVKQAIDYLHRGVELDPLYP